jgi:hypothetical protein
MDLKERRYSTVWTGFMWVTIKSSIGFHNMLGRVHEMPSNKLTSNLEESASWYILAD